MLDIAASLSLAKNTLDLIRGVREAVKQKKLSNEDMLDYLNTLQDKIVDMKTTLADADDENRELKRTITELQEKLAERQFNKDHYEFHDNMVWEVGIRRQPYCPTCFYVDDRLVPLQQRGRQEYHCAIHEKNFWPYNPQSQVLSF